MPHCVTLGVSVSNIACMLQCTAHFLAGEVYVIRLRCMSSYEYVISVSACVTVATVEKLGVDEEEGTGVTPGRQET